MTDSEKTPGLKCRTTNRDKSSGSTSAAAHRIKAGAVYTIIRIHEQLRAVSGRDIIRQSFEAHWGFDSLLLVLGLV